MTSAKDSAREHFRRWLACRLAGCTFAAKFGGRPAGLQFLEVLDACVLDLEDLASFLDLCGRNDAVAVMLLPQVATPADIAGFVHRLGSHDRWEIVIDEKMSRDASEVGMRLTWTTATGDTTNAMGFAPLMTMPTTRRAPYVALAAWTGGHANKRRKNWTSGEVTMGDAPAPVEGDAYSKFMRDTQRETKALCAEDVPVEVLRNLGFRLPREVVENAFVGSIL